MRYILPALLLAISAPALHAQVSNAPRDRPVAFPDDTAAARFFAGMQPYVDEARSTYPAAKERFVRGFPAGHVFFVTARVHDARGRMEQLFVRVERIEAGKIIGRIASQVGMVEGIRYGDPYSLPEAEIVDWLIAKPDGSEEGNYVGKFIDRTQQQH